jgi:glutamine amidotransferase
MCRWLAYSGAPLYLEELIFKPEHSIIDQSLSAREGPSTTNGDGFGIGWFGSRDTPGVYKDIQPAWNDANLRHLAEQIRSHMFLAHVRAATGGTPVQQTNCHPFRHGRWLFLHNGRVRDFPRVRRDLDFGVNPSLYNFMEGTTDSEVMFHLALTFDRAPRTDDRRPDQRPSPVRGPVLIRPPVENAVPQPQHAGPAGAESDVQAVFGGRDRGGLRADE